MRGMHQERSYAIALENAVLPAGMYYGLEPNAWSLRSYRGTVILSGGAHRTGRNGGGTMPPCARRRRRCSPAAARRRTGRRRTA